jgi:hypothetical protein
MKKIFWFSILLLAIEFPTAMAEEVNYKTYISQNASNISTVSIGISRQEVLEIMGSDQSAVRDGPLANPWKLETRGDTEILWYLTRSHPAFRPIRSDQATPIIMEGGKVSAIGSRYLNSISSSKAKTTPVPEKTVEERLATLQKLHDDGAISDEEYEVQKRRILDSI